MRKIFVCILLILLLLKNILVFSENVLIEQFLYYSDKDNNWKIDNLEIEFNNELTWTLNKEKIFLYSNTWWLSIEKLDSISWNIFVWDFYLSGNILWINLIEQDNYLTWLVIDNSTSSHLRLKTNSWVWIKDIYWNEIKFLYTSSFDSYKNINYKNYYEDIDNIENENQENSNSWEILEESNTWALYQEEDENINIWEENDFDTWSVIEETESWSFETEESNTWNIIDEFSWSWILEDETSSWSKNLENSFSWEIKILFQSPSYLLENDLEKEEYNCDTSKTDCKVNFNTNIDEWNWFTSIWTKYICEWDFWFWEITWEEGKCNPNTITYPIWEFETKLKVSEKTNAWNYLEKNLKIKNEWYKEQISRRTIYISEQISNSIYIEPPTIKVQSWLDDKNYCKNIDCKINLIYEQKNSKEKCFWDFSGWEYENWNQNKCNPTYVSYKTWGFKVVLRVFEDWNSSNFKESEIYFSNKILENRINETAKIENNELIKSIITLQWKIWENKTLSWNTLTCFWKCSVNFDWNESIWNNLKYSWDFWNWEVFDGKNPTSINYNIWYYQVKLKVFDENWGIDESYFYVNVLEKIEDEKLIELTENISENIDFSNFENLKISKVLSNPIWSEEFEFIEIKNEWKENINLFWCSLDDEIWTWSKEYTFLENDEILPNKSKKYFKYDTNISLKNSWKEEVNLICFWKIIDNLSFDFSYPEWFILSKNFQNIKEVKKIKNSQNFEINFINWDKKIFFQNEKLDIFEEILSEKSLKEEKIKKVKNVVNKTFSQKVSKQKSWIKIYWNTIPKSEIILKLEERKNETSFLNFFINKTYAENNTIEIKTDENWSYEYFLKSPNIWEFEIKTFLKLWKENVLELDKINTFEVDNDYLEYIRSSNKIINESTYIKPKSIIILQWKLWENKKVYWNKITCFDVESCSINFDWRKSLWNNLEYFWDFWGLETFNKSNPSSFQFPVWKFIVSLNINDWKEESISYFIVEVLWKVSKNEVKTTLKKTKDIFIQTANASSDEEITISISKDIFYIILTFLLFLILFVLILRKKWILSLKNLQ